MKSLILRPTADTFARLQRMMSGAPVHIEWDTMHILLASVPEDTKVKKTEYTGTFQGMDWHYDAELGRSILVGKLDSQDMIDRRDELGTQAEEPPMLIFSANASPGFTNRAWISGLSSVLAQREGEFTFGPEHLLG